VVLGDFLNAVEAGDGVLGALVVGHAIAIAGKSDDVGDADLAASGMYLRKPSSILA